MDASLAELQSREESERFDFKRFESLDDSRKFAKHLVGFANRHGGELALGITDTGEIQGKEIDYDQVMQTITNIAYTRCSPQVRFDDEYLRLPEGDILILDVSPREDIPHAVVERKQGTVISRDYWIRTKNSTRRVSDVELNRLFSTTLDPDFTKDFETWTMLSIDEHQPPSINLPDFIDNYRTLLSKLDIDDEIDQNLILSTISQELFPFSLLHDLSKVHFATWDTVIQDATTPFQSTSLIGANFPKMIGSNDLEQNHDAESVEIDENDIHFSGFDQTHISKFTDAAELLGEVQFHAPRNTEFLIEYQIEERDSDEDVPPFPNYEVKIQRQDEFIITISNHGAGSGRGFPTKHPITDVAADNKFRRIDLGEMQEKWEYAEIRNRFSVEFSYPDEPDTDITLNERYAERLWHLIEERYSVETFLESLPNTELYKANHKLDMVVEALFE